MSDLHEPSVDGPASAGPRALVLGGGGLLGAMYEIGCLAALERESGRALKFDAYVGTSGGAVVASLLAAGYSASELLETADEFSPSNLCRLDVKRFLRASVRLSLQLARQISAGFFRGSASLFGALALLQEAMPAGLLSLKPLEDFLRDRLRARRLEDTFEALPHRLYIPAIDLDTGERVVFGDPDSLRARVSTAVAASCAIPRFFQPVPSGERDLVDGGIADTLNLDVPLERGARQVLVVNPMVAPLNDRETRCLPSQKGGCGHVAEQGLVAALAQSIKISHMIQSGMSFRLHRLTHPDVSVEIIQPDRLEVDLDNPMDFRARARLLALGGQDGARFGSREGSWVTDSWKAPTSGGPWGSADAPVRGDRSRGGN